MGSSKTRQRKSRRRNRRIKEALFARNPKCAYCTKVFYDVEDNDITVDHIVPLSKGGTDEPKNKTLACRKCNNNKGGRLLPVSFAPSPKRRTRTRKAL